MRIEKGTLRDSCFVTAGYGRNREVGGGPHGKGRGSAWDERRNCRCRSIDLLKNIISPWGEENRANSEVASPPLGEEW